MNNFIYDELHRKILLQNAFSQNSEGVRCAGSLQNRLQLMSEIILHLTTSSNPPKITQVKTERALSPLRRTGHNQTLMYACCLDRHGNTKGGITTKYM